MESLPHNYLPSHLHTIMTQNTSASNSHHHLSKDLSLGTSASASTSTQRTKMIHNAVKHIVSRASGRQTLVNLACVGIGKGFSYVLAKVMKRIKSSK